MVDNNFAVLLAKKLLRISTVARETGVSRSTLTSLYYKRSESVTFDVVAKLCRYLGCEVGELFEFIDIGKEEIA